MARKDFRRIPSDVEIASRTIAIQIADHALAAHNTSVLAMALCEELARCLRDGTSLSEEDEEYLARLPQTRDTTAATAAALRQLRVRLEAL